MSSEGLTHEDDGDGGCLVCREWTGTDDVFNRIPWPCPTVRLAAQPAAGEGLDVALREIEAAARRADHGAIENGPGWASGARWAAQWIADHVALQPASEENR